VTLPPRPHELPATPTALIENLDFERNQIGIGDQPGDYAWYKPQDIWSESGWLYWVEEWILEPDGQYNDAFLQILVEGVLKPPAKLFSDVLDLSLKKDPWPMATVWGPLGRCACNWNKRPDSWWRSLHPSHKISQSRKERHGFEVLHIRQESLQTWEWIGDRAWSAYRLAEDARSVGRESDAANKIGRPWPEDQLFRSNMVDIEMISWGSLRGTLNPHISDTDQDSPQGLLKWIANQVVQHPMRLCANSDCHSRFEPSRNQRYCEECQIGKVPARNRKRAERQNRTGN